MVTPIGMLAPLADVFVVMATEVITILSTEMVLGAALFVDEFGDDPARDGLLLAGQLREQEAHAVGGTFWTWKENCSLRATWGIFAGASAGDPRCAYDRPPAYLRGPSQFTSFNVDISST